MEGRVILDVEVGEGASDLVWFIVKILVKPGLIVYKHDLEDDSHLVRGDTLLVLNLALNRVDRVA